MYQKNTDYMENALNKNCPELNFPRKLGAGMFPSQEYR